MTKKEFKKKCKSEKTKSYKFTVIGTILASIGLLFAVGTIIFFPELSIQLVIGDSLAIIFAVTGMALDITGEVMMSKEYKNQAK